MLAAFFAVIIMLISAAIGFFIGAALNGPLEGAILFAMISGMACIISAINKNK